MVMDTLTDGTYTLAQTLSAIRYEEARGYQLIAMAPGPEDASIGGKKKPVNYQSFLDLAEPGAQPKTLELVPIPTGAGGAALIAQRDAQGWDLIVHCQIYVAGKLGLVAGFRKR